MRLIDADEVRKHAFEVDHANGLELEPLMIVPLGIIDNAPTVPLPDFKEGYKQAILDGKTNYSRPEGEWIPVTERLPEDMQKVLIWFEYYRYGDFNCMYQTYGFGYVCDGEWSSVINGETGWKDYNIIAWQPLPEPYEKGGKE